MASSPPAPYSSNLSNAKKRLSMSSQVSLPASKRPKMHPLRQTSYPANGDAIYGAASARSETGSVANSAFSAVSTSKAPPRGRGRPRKSLQLPDTDTRAARQNGSAAGPKNSQTKSVISATRSGAGENAEEELEEDEDDDIDDLERDDKEIDDQKREDERQNHFIGQLTSAQSDRWTQYRVSKLRHAVVRRIVNQTVSQSVADNALQAVQFFSKAFAIEIVERAREVQSEWAEAADVGIEYEKLARQQKLQDKQVHIENEESTAKAQCPPVYLTTQQRIAQQQEIKKLKDKADEYIPNKHKGGLLPDHLREALRRYKADGDGNGFGFDGSSHPLLGVHGANAWRLGEGASGQRLFR